MKKHLREICCQRLDQLKTTSTKLKQQSEHTTPTAGHTPYSLTHIIERHRKEHIREIWCQPLNHIRGSQLSFCVFCLFVFHRLSPYLFWLVLFPNFTLSYNPYSCYWWLESSKTLFERKRITQHNIGLCAASQTYGFPTSRLVMRHGVRHC